MTQRADKLRQQMNGALRLIRLFPVTAASAALLIVALATPLPASLSDPARAQAGGLRRDATGSPAQGAAARLAKGKFLVASRSLLDPNFSETVILLVDYDPNGALGVVVNRPTPVALIDALPELDELRARKDVVYLGGPVARDRMLLLVRTGQQPPQSLRIFGRVFASGSLDALRKSMAQGDSIRAYAGYAGWGPGQLDMEVARGDWFIGPADSDAVFTERPTAVWSDLIERFSGDWAALPAP
jgi:putative transcriptional regulator